jgi:hypothetical protein
MSRQDPPAPPLCPSAQPDWKGAVVVGVVGGTADEPRVGFLESPLEVNAELLELAQPVRPTEVFRFAAPCRARGCRHFGASTCHLATKVVRLLPEVVDGLPECDIRPRCRWFAQEGGAACLRCPQVVTNDTNPSEALRIAADPATPIPT